MPNVRIEPLERRRLLAVVLDTAYGENGFVPGGDDVWQVIGRRRDGSVLVGVSNPSGQVVQAVRPDGTVDPSFRDEGDAYNIVGSDYFLDRQERLIYVGLRVSDSGDQLPVVLRYKRNGERDSSFATTEIPRPGPYKNTPVAYFNIGDPKVDSQGRVVVSTYAEFSDTGTVLDVDYSRGYIERTKAGGGRDLSFGDNGRVVSNGSLTELTADDRIVELVAPAGRRASFVRYTEAGKLDASFGGDGAVSLPADVSVSTGAMAIDASGRIVLAYAKADEPKRVFVRRFTANGNVDRTFGTNGLATLTDDAFAGTSGAASISVDHRGRIVGGANQGLFRLTADGKTDTDFGTDGVIPTGQAYLYYTLPTPEGIYAAAKIGEKIGVGRFVEADTIRFDATDNSLAITGTPGDDDIGVRPSGGGVGVTVNGKAERVFAGVKMIRIEALAGDDRVDAAAAGKTGISLGDGDDRCVVSTAVCTVFGNDGDDAIITGGHAATIDAGDGDDTVRAGVEADTIESGAGDDTVSAGNGLDQVNNAGDSDTVDLGPGGGVFAYGNGDESATAPQTVTGRGGRSTRYTVITGQGADAIALVGGGITVDAGYVVRDGEQGNGNRVSALAAVRADVSMTDNDPYVVTGDGDDLIRVYDPKPGGRGRVSAGAGDDTIMTHDGRDTLNCGPGDDVVIDSGGDNRVYGGPGRDSIRTSAGDDTVYGDAGQDTLRSTSGDDRLDGGDAGDLLQGGVGRDTLVGGRGRDRAILQDEDETSGVETLIR